MIDYDFEEEIVLVTGGTKGIGRAITLSLLSHRAKLVICFSKDESSARELENILAQNHCKDFLIIQSDVSNRQDIKFLLSASRKKWEKDISLVVNNAGILNQKDFFKIAEDNWDRTLAVNLKGPFLICQEVIPLMKKKRKGAIVNIASVGGQTGGTKAMDYAASKAGLICLTQSLAKIGAKYGIRVNAVSPGWIDTGIFTTERYKEIQKELKSSIPLQRLGKAEEVADAVLFLLSKKSSYITGQILNVNGGMHF